VENRLQKRIKPWTRATDDSEDADDDEGDE